MNEIIKFYKDVWKGNSNSSEEELSRLLSRCCDIVDNAISFSGYTVETVPEIYKTRVYKAVCSHVDYVDNNGGIDSITDMAYNSVSLGKFSYSADKSANSANSTFGLCSSALEYLIPTGLLYRKVDVF